MSIEDDFFSVATTIPLVATVEPRSVVYAYERRIRQDFSSKNRNNSLYQEREV